MVKSEYAALKVLLATQSKKTHYIFPPRGNPEKISHVIGSDRIVTFGLYGNNNTYSYKSCTRVGTREALEILNGKD